MLTQLFDHLAVSVVLQNDIMLHLQRAEEGGRGCGEGWMWGGMDVWRARGGCGEGWMCGGVDVGGVDVGRVDEGRSGCVEGWMRGGVDVRSGEHIQTYAHIHTLLNLRCRWLGMVC